MHATVSVVIEQGGGHLRPPCVMDADEEDFRNVIHDASFRLAERGELCPGDANEDSGEATMQKGWGPEAASHALM